MQSFRVLSVVFDAENDRVEVVKEITEDDGSTNLNLHTFHPETLEWRAAEYGIDDMEELFDLVLHEPFIEDVLPLQLPLEVARSLSRTRVSQAKSKLASTKARSSADHKARLRTAGVDAKYISAADVTPMDAIKLYCPFDQEVIDVKRAHIEKARKDLRDEHEQKLQRPKQTPQQRAASLSKLLTREGERQAPQGLGKVNGQRARLAPITLAGNRVLHKNE